MSFKNGPIILIYNTEVAQQGYVHLYTQQDKMLHMDGPRTLWCCSGSEDIWKKSCIHKGMLMYDMKAARVL